MLQKQYSPYIIDYAYISCLTRSRIMEVTWCRQPKHKLKKKLTSSSRTVARRAFSPWTRRGKRERKEKHKKTRKTENTKENTKEKKQGQKKKQQQQSPSPVIFYPFNVSPGVKFSGENTPQKRHTRRSLKLDNLAILPRSQLQLPSDGEKKKKMPTK